MFLGIINILGRIFLFTWFIWPFLFVYSFAYGIKELMQNEKKTANLALASFSLLMIICGLCENFIS